MEFGMFVVFFQIFAVSSQVDDNALVVAEPSSSNVSLLNSDFLGHQKKCHVSNGDVEHDKRCEICVTSSGISRHPRRVNSESYTFDWCHFQRI